MIPRLPLPAPSQALSVSLLIALLQLTAVGPASAQQADEPPVNIVSIYRIAPGQHAAFVEWMANQQAASEEAGGPASQWYVHMNGDSWDFLIITPETTEEQDQAIDAALEARGLATGARAAMEIRQYVASHTDTFTAGPMSASEVLEAVRPQ
ncbi:MAG: hypothetical protein ACREMK_00725 [Gemmatimonadota bacterium]